MRLIKIIMIIGLVSFMAASTASAERSLWLTPKDLDGNYIEDAYVWKSKDPWLHKSYVVGAEPFLLEISNHSLGRGKKDKTAKNVRLVLAISDPDKVDSIFIDRVDIWDPDSVKKGIPKLASARRMQKHGVFPASFIEYDINDVIPQNEAVELEIAVYGEVGLKVHFDVYGEGRPKKCKRKHYKDRWYHKHYWYKWHHKYYKGKWHHKHCHHNKNCFRDVFNPFSHDVTVKVEESLQDCGSDDYAIIFTPGSVDLRDPPRDERALNISVDLKEGSNCNANIEEILVRFPRYLTGGKGGGFAPVFPVVNEVSNPADPVPLDNYENSWTDVSLQFSLQLQLFWSSATNPNNSYVVGVELYDNNDPPNIIYSDFANVILPPS